MIDEGYTFDIVAKIKSILVFIVNFVTAIVEKALGVGSDDKADEEVE